MPGVVRVLEDAPAHRSVAESYVFQFMDGVHEIVVVLGVDVIVDQDAHRAVGHLRLDRQLLAQLVQRILPVHTELIPFLDEALKG